MELSDIKRGDILVAYYPDISVSEYRRNYIIFIASGQITSKNFGYKTKFATIETLAHINLTGKFQSINVFNKYLGICITELAIDPRDISIIRKPTFSEMTELINRLKENGYRYNRKCIKICRI